MLLLYFWFDKAERGQDSLRNTLRRKAVGPTLPFFAAALFFGLMAMKVQSGENFLGLLEVHSDAVGAIRAYDTFPLTGRLQVACYGFLQYILRFFFPSEMCAFYPYPTQAEYGASPFLLRLRAIRLDAGIEVVAMVVEQTHELGHFFRPVILTRLRAGEGGWSEFFPRNGVTRLI